MTEPGEGLPKTRPANPEITTGVMRNIDQLDSLNANRLEPLPPRYDPLPEAPPYKKERIFSRKVMIAWAAATLVLYFWVTFIVPAVIDTVKAEIMSRMEAPTTNTAAPAPGVAPVAPVEPVHPGHPAQPPKPPAPKK